MAQQDILLSEEQNRWWQRLVEIYALQKAQDLYHLQLSLRQLAMEIVTQAPEQDCIVVSGQTLKKFSDIEAKQTYIAQHSRSGDFTEDAVLFALLHALGFQPVVELPSSKESTPFRYVPFEQQTGNTLRIDLVSDANAFSRKTETFDSYKHKTGSHWSLKGHSTPGTDHSCAFFAVAQRIREIGEKNLPMALPKRATKRQSQAHAQKEFSVKNKSSSTIMTKTLGLLPVSPENKTVKEVEKEFAQREEKDHKSFENEKKKLALLATQDLITI